ncbi:DinB family protein [Fodinicola acaciae]|uniref:DinB family protein n=1 Tax=Fodinicola acaciae TaxID=2681555 RepID=UPI0013D75DA3|nr:DinB family protein [Fodinicola acaciae]
MPLDKDDLVSTAPEGELLEGFLDYHRDVLSGKLRGLSEADVRRRLVPSRTTLIGLVKHAAAVERNWFQHYLAQRPRDQIDGNAVGDAESWLVRPDETVANVVAEFDAACAASRRIAATFDLDHLVPHETKGQVSARWIHVHLIREHARHIGHADILREQTDGQTGDSGHSGLFRNRP